MSTELLVDDEPAFHLDIPSLHPAYTFASSPASEHSSHELEPKFQGPPCFSSSNCTCMPSSEEKPPTGLACFDKYMCNLAELSSWDMHHLSSVMVPEGDKRQTTDESVCRRMGTTNGDNSRGSGHVGDLQASMEALKVNHMPGFNYYMGVERDYGSNVQAPIAPLMGHHPGSDDCNYVDDHPAHASVFTLSCMSPPGDNSFWRFLPSNHEEHSADFFSSDEFRMYEFKVRRCMRGRSHDWTECPFAHPGEKARRRDPRRFNYSGTACPDFRRGMCRRGDSCELSHGVFECWLHPARYRTQLCKDGKSCKRRVCFFAHSLSQLRYVAADIPDNGFTLKSPLASPNTDAMASYFDVLYKHLPFFANNSSPVGQGSPRGYGGDVLFDDFSPANIHGFPHDGVHDGFCPIAVHSKRAQSDKTFENFNGKNGHGHGTSTDDTSNHVKLNCRSYMPSSNGYHLANEFGYDGSHGYSLYPYTSSHPSPDSSGFKASQAHVNLRNQLALASLTSNFDQIMSPTSTLIGHVFSPPPLSPPLSPTDSPPVSPGAAFSSRSTLSRKLAALSGQPLSQGLAPGMDANPMIANGTSPSVSQFHASQLANLAHNNGAPPLFANARGPSPLSTNSLTDKKQDLDRLSSMQTSQELMEDESLQTDTYPAHQAAMAHLISTLRRMEVRGATTNVKNGRRLYSPHSNPNMPQSRIDDWDGNGVASNQRVESGQGLRAKIYGKIGRDAGVDSENPDLGWVNELVK